MIDSPAVPATQRASVQIRIIAKIFDFIVFVFLAAVFPRPFGPLVGFLYSILGDGFRLNNFQGQSIGKVIMSLQVVNIKNAKPIGFRESAIRNAPLGVATFFSIIPLWGWIILGLLGIPLMVMEIYLMFTVETGLRLGDVMADTVVIKGKRLRKMRPQVKTVKESSDENRNTRSENKQDHAQAQNPVQT